ncbi:AsmA family protein [Methylonatrum kenyense]|uniref:AsmA family protein n=1 Tax=Methylonatrum kenyense TaxID=455253 RepID=UPI0020BE62D9|nr:AsmA family protein [Methylonatrum kenyense]MCK8516020.1 AsmA family protein [Methylonatrum kenyense]
MRWLLITAGILLTLYLGLALVLDRVEPRAQIERQAEEMLGLAVEFDGDASLLLFPRPGFRFAAAELANPEEFPDGSLATLEGVRVTLSLPALLRGQLVVDQLHIDDGSVNLARDTDATGNWESLQIQPQGDEGPPVTLSLHRARQITADRLRIRYHEADTEAHYQLLLTDLELDDLEAGARGHLRSDWQVQGANGLDLSGAMESRLRLREGGWGLGLGIESFSMDGRISDQPIGITGEGRLLVDLERPGLQLRDAHLADDGNRLDLSGTLVLRDGRPYAVGDFELAASDLRRSVERISNAKLEMEDDAAFRELALAGRLRLDDRRISIAELEGALDQTGISGNLDWNNEPAELRLQLDFGELDLDRYTPPEPDPEMVRAVIELLATLASRHEISGYLQWDRLETLDLAFERFRTDLQGDRRNLSLSPVTAAAWDGELDGAVTIDLESDPRAYDVRLSTFGIDPAIPLSTLFEGDFLSGDLDLDLSGRFHGQEWPAIRDSLDAEGTVFLSAAEIRGFSLKRQVEDSVPSSLGGASRDTFGDDATTEISQLEGELRIRDGRLENPSASARSRHFEAQGEGVLALDTLELDYRLLLRMVETFETDSERLLSLLRDIDVPVRLHGPLAELETDVSLPGTGDDESEEATEEDEDDADQEDGTMRSSSPLE